MARPPESVRKEGTRSEAEGRMQEQERFAPFCAFQKGVAGGRKGDSASPSQMDQHTIPGTSTSTSHLPTSHTKSPFTYKSKGL